VTKVEDYRRMLSKLEDWEAYLGAESRLPGPRGNLELAQAVALEASDERIWALAARVGEQSPENTPQVFVAFCGVLGLGRLAAAGQPAAIGRLETHASDRRWRIREAVAMALQTVGRADPILLRQSIVRLVLGDRYQQRAAVAALCEPDLLSDPHLADDTLDVLDALTAGLGGAADRRSEPFRALRKALGYGWSVAIVARPTPGRQRFAVWLASDDPDIRWLLRENLRKARLERLDADWVEACRRQLAGQ
jgi:hypothetical protein